MNLTRSICFTLVFLIALAIPFAAIAQDADEETVEWDGISFDLEDLEGDDQTEEEIFVGADIYLVDFWASWCQPCSQYLPQLEQMVEDYEDYNFKVVIFCVDNANTLSTAKSKIASEDYPFDILFDTESEVKDDLGVRNIPTTILFDAEGEELWRHAGYAHGTEDEVREHIEALLPDFVAEEDEES